MSSQHKMKRINFKGLLNKYRDCFVPRNDVLCFLVIARAFRPKQSIKLYQINNVNFKTGKRQLTVGNFVQRLLPTSYCPLPTAHCLLPIAYCLLFIAYCLLPTVLTSCGGGGNSQATDTPTSGKTNIVVDESYSLLFDTQIYTFESFYKKAKINASYKPEDEALSDLLNDSCKVIVINRELTTDEKKRFESEKIFPRATKIAEDAIALIVNNSNEDSLLTVEQLKAILQGNDSLWSQLNASSQLGAIHVVFDNNNSANARYMKEEMMEGKSFQKNCFAVKSNPEVINYVSNNKNAVGIISVNWISDKDDTLTQGFLKKVKVMGIAKNKGDSYYKPYQAYIKTKDYPFCRDVYMINRQTRSGLGMGFVAFVAGEKGQRMILKAGLIPAIAPVRIVNIKNE